MKQIYLSIGLMFGAGALQAGQFCELDGTEMFTCTLKGGTQGVEVCNAVWADGTKAAYGFFKSNGAVEKEILQDMATISASPWNGMGNFMSESVTFDGGGGYAYEVWWGGERAADATEMGGINVMKDGALIADLPCDAGSVNSDLSSLIELIEAAQ
ncbi:hypothetical protein [Tritonibacter mobilis]|uniref:hypothetical protein n=1 Tax=Tritonibacter mobilis TaxID=379347 RepID=UPI0039A78166